MRAQVQSLIDAGAYHKALMILLGTSAQHRQRLRKS